MKYSTPMVQNAGIASELIQFKPTPQTDGGVQGHTLALSNLLEQK